MRSCKPLWMVRVSLEHQFLPSQAMIKIVKLGVPWGDKQNTLPSMTIAVCVADLRFKCWWQIIRQYVHGHISALASYGRIEFMFWKKNPINICSCVHSVPCFFLKKLFPIRYTIDIFSYYQNYRVMGMLQFRLWHKFRNSGLYNCLVSKSCLSV